MVIHATTRCAVPGPSTPHRVLGTTNPTLPRIPRPSRARLTPSRRCCSYGGAPPTLLSFFAASYTDGMGGMGVPISGARMRAIRTLYARVTRSGRLVARDAGRPERNAATAEPGQTRDKCARTSDEWTLTVLAATR